MTTATQYLEEQTDRYLDQIERTDVVLHEIKRLVGADFSMAEVLLDIARAYDKAKGCDPITYRREEEEYEARQDLIDEDREAAGCQATD